MSDVTQILSRIESGDPQASEVLVPLVYEELRKLAAAKLACEVPGQTLQATDLVNEAYLRLVDVEEAQHWNSRGHFVGAAAEAMRRILINRARDKKRLKRGGDRKRVDLDKIELALDTPADELLHLDDALQRLAEENQECAELVKMRFYAGMSLRECATGLGISSSTADRYWAYARAWLFESLRPNDASSGR